MKNKKILLTIGSIAATATPVLTVVSCDQKEIKSKDNSHISPVVLSLSGHAEQANENDMLLRFGSLLPLASQAINNGLGNTLKNHDTVLNSLLNTFLSKKIKTGELRSDFEKYSDLIKGLVNGFDTEGNTPLEREAAFKNALNKVLPAFGKDINVMSGMSFVPSEILAGLAVDAQFNKDSGDVSGTAMRIIFNKYLDNKLKQGVHTLISKGIFGMTSSDFKNIIEGLKDTINHLNAISSTDAIAEKIKDFLSDTKVHGQPLLGWLLNLANDFTINKLPDSLFDLLNTPLKDVKANSIDNIISFINSLGLLKTNIPYLGETIHSFLHDLAGSLNGGQWASIGKLFKMSDIAIQNWLKNNIGNDYSNQTLTLLKEQAAAVTLADEANILDGVEVKFSYTYEQVRRKINEAKAYINGLTNPTIDQLAASYNKLSEAKYLAYVYSVEKSIIDDKNAEYTKVKESVQTVIENGIPADVAIEKNLVSQLNNRSYDDLKSKWDLLIKGIDGKNISELNHIKEQLLNIKKKLDILVKDKQTLKEVGRIPQKSDILNLLKAEGHVTQHSDASAFGAATDTYSITVSTFDKIINLGGIYIYKSNYGRGIRGIQLLLHSETVPHGRTKITLEAFKAMLTPGKNILVRVDVKDNPTPIIFGESDN